MMSEKFNKFIQNYNTFVFVGNGGTGKTTLSASWAIEAAKAGKKVGLLTIDPSKRLGDVFGMNIAVESFKSVPFEAGSVDVHLIDSQQVIKEFVVKNFSQSEYDKLQKNRIFSQITSVLSDNQSLSTIYKLNELIKSKKYDIFVVDTP
ncbi:MAG: AAA family ATPase, partial [Bdellovibrionaceae bacterium]|nr:AAA family ATPase [Pseudobdellovibrionaceae bacterium]